MQCHLIAAHDPEAHVTNDRFTVASLHQQSNDDWNSAPGTGDEVLGINELRHALRHLVRAVTSSLEDDLERAEEHLQRTATLIGLDLSKLRALATESVVESCRSVRGGLAPWQIQRVKTHIEAKLGLESLANDRLAQMVGLTPLHFCRSFRQSFGEPPHGYVIRRRVERAQGLMLQSSTVLSHIALQCGFADQSHFNRVFRKYLGESPGAWRRARCVGPT